MSIVGVYYETEYRALIDNMMDFIDDGVILQRIRRELVRIDEGAEKAREEHERNWWSGRSFYPTREEIERNNPAR